MSDAINRRSVDELHDLNIQQRLDSLFELSSEMLDSLTPTELEQIPFDWFRAYHATMCDSNYIQIKELSMMAPQLRRSTLHNIILARDDRSFDTLDEPTVQRLLVIFSDRKSKAGHPFAPPPATTDIQSPNQFSVHESFFNQPTKFWAAQAEDLPAIFDGFNVSGENTIQRRPGTLTSGTTSLQLDLGRLNLDSHSQAPESSSANANIPNLGSWRWMKPVRRKVPLSRREEARKTRHL